jgi:uncharacterized membrane protein YtjA (UPF0391 family)
VRSVAAGANGNKLSEKPLENQAAKPHAKQGGNATIEPEENLMLGWALTFLIVALIAAVLGFGGIAAFAVDIAKIVFFVAIVLFLISVIIGLVRGRSPTVP